MPGWLRIEWWLPRQTMWQYGSSLNTATSRPRTTSAIRFKSSFVVTPPVGLCGEFKKIARGDGSSFRKRSMSATVGRKPFACLQRREHGARAAPLDVRHDTSGSTG